MLSLEKIRTARRSFELRQTTKAKLSHYDCPLICCVRNEYYRLAFFLQYYRQLGVDHFVFIDNGSTDGTGRFLNDQTDCSVYYTDHSYKDSNFGMDWCNYLLHKYAREKWAICVDPDEYLVYPNCETRNIGEITDYMDEIGQPSLFSVMIDCYSDRSISQTVLTSNDNPFEICPYFDRFNFIQSLNEERNHCWVQGGVRMRVFFRDNPYRAPALNKVPLIKWRRGYYYTSSMHQLNRQHLDCCINQSDLFLSGCLFHFKYVSSLQDKAAEEMKRKQHYDDSFEYKRYAERSVDTFYHPDISVRYQGSGQLEDLQFMRRGEWF